MRSSASAEQVRVYCLSQLDSLILILVSYEFTTRTKQISQFRNVHDRHDPDHDHDPHYHNHHNHHICPIHDDDAGRGDHHYDYDDDYDDDEDYDNYDNHDDKPQSLEFHFR